MKKIKLTQGKVALVDDEDYEYLNQWKWYALKCKTTFYAVRHPPRNLRKQSCILMHRVIMKTPDTLQVDHIDRDGLNCQKNNMRNCTHGQNQMNKAGSGMSKYRGVTIYFDKRRGNNTKRIIAEIKHDNKRYRLGCFKTEELAAIAYDKMAIELHGEYANLNFK